MSQQLQITGGAKVRSLEGVITGTTGVLNSLPINGSLGIPQLDVNGKILVSQLPNSVMEYLGTWNAATNTPTLANGTGNAGDVYLCNVAGTVDFGAGPISFVVSDQVIYSGTIWQKASGTSGTVTSVAASITGNSLGITGSPITTAGTLAFAFAGTNLQYVNGAGNLTTFPTLISSIGLSMPSAFSVSNSPLTANGTIAVAGAGSTAQYIRGDGTLATFPAVGGGGGGINFYLNGGTSQGTISGNTYYQMSPNAVIDTGVDFSTSVNGVVGYFLTDVSSPNQLKIPAGNWNFELYFSASSNGGSPSFYVEVFKYNTGVFTLLGSSVANPEGITNGTAIDLYVTAVAIPTTTLIVSDRIALRITVSTSGRTITLHTQGTHLCEVLTTFPSGISALNGLTLNTQYFATGTSGSDFNIASVLDTHTFNIPDAGASARGVMTTGTQTIAGAKTFSGNLTANSFIKIGGGNLEFLKADGSVDSTAYVQSVTATSPLVRTGATNTPILSIPAATSSVNGYLTSTDWNTFNNKTSASGTASQIAYFTGANSLASDSFLWWDASLNRIGIGDFSVITPPAALSMISTIGAWYNRNVASTVNYSEIGLYYDGATYGHLIQSNKVGTTDYSRISFINNGQTALVLAEDYNVGINTRVPVPNITGVSGQGLDIFGGSFAASLAFHTTASGSTITDGARLYLVNAGNLILNNLETGSVIINADNGDVVLQAGGFEKLRAISSGNVSITGSLQQSAVTSAILKASSTGVIVAAVAGTDYLAVGSAVTSVTGTSPVVSSGGTTPAISMAAATTSVSGYLTSTDWNTFNGKFTLPSLTAGSVLFSNGSTIAQNNANFFWSTGYNSLGIGTQPSVGYVLHVYAATNANAYALIDNPNATGQSGLYLKSNGGFQAGFKYNVTGNITEVFSNVGDIKLTAGAGFGLTIANAGTASFYSSVTATSFVKSGGTSSQFLKADGSVDSTAYGTGTVTSVTGTAPVVSSGGATPAISMAAATASVNGYLTSTNFTTFNNKFTLPSLTAGSVLFSDGSTIAQDNSAFFWNNTSKALKVTTVATGTAAPYAIHGVGTNCVIMAENPNATGVVAIRMDLNGFTQTSLSYSSVSARTSLSSNYGALRLEASSGNGVTFATTGAATFDSSIAATSATFSGEITSTTGNNSSIISNSSITTGWINLIYGVSTGANVALAMENSTGGNRAVGTLAYAGVLSTYTNTALQLGTNNNIRLTITGTGNVGIGTTSPSAKFMVLSDTNTSATNIGRFAAANNTLAIGIGYETIRQTETGGSILFETNATERMRITSGGEVLINGTSNTYSNKVKIEGGANLLSLLRTSVREYGFQISSGGEFTIRDYTAAADRFLISSSGVVTISALGSGTVTATSGVLSAVSDMNLKIEDGFIDNALEKVLKLTPRYFLWKEESGLPTDLRQLGFYAQEVNSALGEEVANTPKTENDSWGIYDRGIIAMLTKAIQEQQATITSLQDRLDKLENK